MIRRSTVSQPVTSALRSSTTGRSICRRLNASSCAVTAAVRSAAFRMSSTSARTASGTSDRREDEIRGAEHDAHLVVGLVGHAAGQPAHRLHAVRLAEPLLGDRRSVTSMQTPVR